jgi:hypothetical protein
MHLFAKVKKKRGWKSQVFSSVHAKNSDPNAVPGLIRSAYPAKTLEWRKKRKKEKRECTRKTFYSIIDSICYPKEKKNWDHLLFSE